MVNDLRSYSETNPKFAQSINNVTAEIITRYRAEGFFIYEIISDNDTSFKSLSIFTNQLNCKHTQVSPKSNFTINCCNIRFIKDRARCVLQFII